MEHEKMKHQGTSKLRLLVLVGLLVVAGGVAFFWLRPGTRGAVEYHLQRLGHEDRKVARKSEIALLSLGKTGRQALFDFIVRKLNISLVPLAFKRSDTSQACKILAISRDGGVEVRGPVGPAGKIVLLADASVPAEKVLHPLSALAASGTIEVATVAFAPGSEMTSLDLYLAYLNRGTLQGYITLRVGPEKVDLAGEAVAQPEDVAEILKGKTADSIRIVPRPGVRYARLLRYIYCLSAAGKRAVLVFGDPEVFTPTSPKRLEKLSNSLESADETERKRAAGAIKAAVGSLFSYDLSKPPGNNRNAVTEWLEWFRRNRDYLYYDTVLGRYVYDAGASAAGLKHDRYWLHKLEITGNKRKNNKHGREGDADG
jgi:hypothetical protein